MSTQFREEKLTQSNTKKMTDDALKKAIRSSGCRLCLAPDTECVPIFATAAADKEPLSTKIFSCVNIKVSIRADYVCSTWQWKKSKLQLDFITGTLSSQSSIRKKIRPRDRAQKVKFFFMFSYKHYNRIGEKSRNAT